ncbi:DUF4124 domain-containing protein [Shewanella gelidii]|uniref:DUF4124 domain-containing protein n=1 Tax=Shewanella gelidii TaxID=1642821 RepID=A0A917JRD3_9GAMM|nr:DUF4124 domain-containing protein [Shewanella gelidii]MCL1098469.1 DUF4124 domain-containing protein [Shewanella gelidii]GGI82523.1 hypothetical protein GCM10009332_19670 [Shewanella gelidii]
MRLFLLACLAVVPIIAQATVYRWVDENGKVHYSDKPTSNAEIVTLKENTHNKVTVPKAIDYEKDVTAQEAEVAVDYKLSIISPEQEATIRDNDGNVDIVATTQPKPPKSALYTLYMDGKLVGEAQHNAVFNLKNIDRGTHQFEVKMITQSGKVLASSSPRTVFLHRARVGNVQKAPKAKS